jgi:hypothetical protein
MKTKFVSLNGTETNLPTRTNLLAEPRRHKAALLRVVWRQAMPFGLGLSLLSGLLIGAVNSSFASGVQIFGSLANFDVRYPNSLPNDIEIVLYGDGLKTNDVVGTWNSSSTVVPGVGWGLASSITATVSTDTNSPAYGLDCVSVRYSGPPRPDLVGHVVHFGVRLRISTAVAHQEVWWTLNGQRILRPCDTHVTWIGTTNGWLIAVANPNPIPIYVYGPRYFQIPAASPLPLLNQMNTSIQPSTFGAAAWTSLSLPGGQRVYCIPAWCRIHLRVPVTRWRPIIFQIAARTVPESVLPLPSGTIGPNPNDFDGEQGTMFIGTMRPTQEFPEDINGDGAVGIPDFNQLRSQFGTTSEDVLQTQ